MSPTLSRPSSAKTPPAKPARVAIRRRRFFLEGEGGFERVLFFISPQTATSGRKKKSMARVLSSYQLPPSTIAQAAINDQIPLEPGESFELSASLAPVDVERFALEGIEEIFLEGIEDSEGVVHAFEAYPESIDSYHPGSVVRQIKRSGIMDGGKNSLMPQDLCRRYVRIKELPVIKCGQDSVYQLLAKLVGVDTAKLREVRTKEGYFSFLNFVFRRMAYLMDVKHMEFEIPLLLHYMYETRLIKEDDLTYFMLGARN